MPIDTFRAALLVAYRERPCQVLPNALWKTLAEIPNYTCTFAADDERVMHLQMSRDEALLLYWHRFQRDRQDRQPSQFPESLWAKLRFALLHTDFADGLGLVRSGDRPERVTREAYFRLRHDLDSVPEVTLPSGFRFVGVSVEREASIIAEFIAKCYDNIALSAADVRRWPRLPVFDQHLAFWIVDTVMDGPVALAVSHFDVLVPEVSLEWIQVHPDYRRRGLGAALVQETLTRARARARAQGRAAFATVSGVVSNSTNPEALYRRCGFSGDDVWFVIRR